MAATLRFKADWIRTREFSAGEDGQTRLCDIPAGALIPPGGVILQVLEGFEGGSIQIGDKDNPLRWFDQETAGPGTYESQAPGKLYTAAGGLYVVVTGAASGRAVVFVQTLDNSDLI